MRRLRPLVVLCTLVVVAAPASAQSTPVDSALAHIERLAVSQARAEARVVADSLLSTLPALHPRYPDALYWRAFASSNAADAERDYLRVSIEYPLSSRAPDALLALAQLEYARGDRQAARRRFDKLLRDYPSGRHVARASYWSGRLAMDEGDRAAACGALEMAKSTVAAGDIELRNQVDFLLGQCAIPLAPIDTTVPPPAEPPVTQTAGRTFSVQIAAFSTRADANALANRLKERSFDVRVVGTRAPFRVRIGRYPTRAAAVAALGRIRDAGLDGIVVEAEPR